MSHARHQPRKRLGLSLYVAALAAFGCALWPVPIAAQTRLIYPQPIILAIEGRPIQAEEGYIAVPENRAKPDSRDILIPYYRLKALKPSNRQPVFLLPGGPGGILDRTSFAKDTGFLPAERQIIGRLIADRDVVVVNQRGNPWLIANFTAFRAAPPKLPPTADPTRQEVIAGWDASLRRTYAELSAQGVDLSGYDIRNSVEDIEDLRAALGYDRIVLLAVSFGSQWGLSYIRTYPDRVARAIFSGVEPIDHTYDSADGLWAALERVADAAQRSPIRDQLPPGGLAAAVKTVLARLAAAPAVTTITDPASGAERTMTVRREDVQALLLSPWQGQSLREAVEAWPKFITEVYAGDYRYVAQRKTRGLFPFNGNINLPLIDHSLGISAARDARLRREGAQAIIGDPNQFYRDWAAGTPTKVVDDDFRRFVRIDVPMLLIQGDMDWSTPLENARDQRRHLSNGALVTVRGGTHAVQYEIVDLAPALAARVERFAMLDAEPELDPRAFLATFPENISLPLDFLPPGGASLYERATAQSRRP